MSHPVTLAEGLDRPGPSLPATDLLMSKLQIVELNAKDRSDRYALLEACEIADGDHQRARTIPAGRDDRGTDCWGLHHTFELNLQRLRDGLTAVPDADSSRITAAVDALATAMEDTPKSRG